MFSLRSCSPPTATRTSNSSECSSDEMSRDRCLISEYTSKLSVTDREWRWTMSRMALIALFLCPPSMAASRARHRLWNMVAPSESEVMAATIFTRAAYGKTKPDTSRMTSHTDSIAPVQKTSSNSALEMDMPSACPSRRSTRPFATTWMLFKLILFSSLLIFRRAFSKGVDAAPIRARSAGGTYAFAFGSSGAGVGVATGGASTVMSSSSLSTASDSTSASTSSACAARLPFRHDRGASPAAAAAAATCFFSFFGFATSSSALKRVFFAAGGASASSSFLAGGSFRFLAFVGAGEGGVGGVTSPAFSARRASFTLSKRCEKAFFFAFFSRRSCFRRSFRAPRRDSSPSIIDLEPFLPPLPPLPPFSPPFEPFPLPF
eukprot:Rhum_TRINITY_DN14535_c15_g1::Rhum_TRINITY_DN14535_c15_g1_i1::g.98374::m.98374